MSLYAILGIVIGVFALLLLGNTIGKKIMNHSIEKYCNILASLLLILIGFIEL